MTADNRRHVEELILDLAQHFGRELARLDEKCSFGSYHGPKLFLEVSLHEHQPKMNLRFYNPVGADVEAKSLGRLLDEVAHRFQFDERERGIEPLRALEAGAVADDDPVPALEAPRADDNDLLFIPSDHDNDIPF